MVAVKTARHKLQTLPTAERIPKRWKHMQAAKESRHGETEWKKNPLKIVQEPTSVTVFKRLSDKLRSRMFRLLAVRTRFNPSKLVTYQPVISASAVMDFVKDPKLSKKRAYVLKTEKGYCVWNGNHRAVAALLSDRKFTAMCLDLTGGSNEK